MIVSYGFENKQSLDKMEGFSIDKNIDENSSDHESCIEKINLGVLSLGQNRKENCK